VGLSERFNEALVFAADLHAGQLRKGMGVPYVSHLLAVASLVLEAGGDEDEAIAALLHDAVEDQGGQETLEAIRSRFGERVADTVWGCTDTDEVPKPPWRARKEAYIRHLDLASPSVLLVSNADKVHNARATLSDYREMGDALWDRFNASGEEILWYYRSLSEVFTRRRPSPLARELERTVSELERLGATSTD
jgi:(p)ppGpp synthase/HD superfamily hydrolase